MSKLKKNGAAKRDTQGGGPNFYGRFRPLVAAREQKLYAKNYDKIDWSVGPKVKMDPNLFRPLKRAPWPLGIQKGVQAEPEPIPPAEFEYKRRK